MSNLPPIDLVLLGPPGVGKGTQAALLARKLDVPHISTGAMFREMIAEGSALAREAETFVDRGEYVPDHITDALVAWRLSRPDAARGFILDGYPRTLEQAKALDKALDAENRRVDLALDLTAPDEVLLSRIALRLALEDRPDDIPEVARHRLEKYRLQTRPVAEYYARQGKLISLDASGSVPDVAAAVARSLAEQP